MKPTPPRRVNVRSSLLFSRLAALRCLALMVVAFAITGCASSSGATKTPLHRAPTATPRPTPTPLPSQFRLLENGGLGVIEVAFNRIVDEHVTPVDEAALLTAAWGGVQRVARSDNLPAPAAPSFSGDRTVDIESFSRGWLAL